MNQPWNNQQNTITPNNIFGKPQTTEANNPNNVFGQQPSSFNGNSQNNTNIFGSSTGAPSGSFGGNTVTSISNWGNPNTTSTFGNFQPQSNLSSFGGNNQNIGIANQNMGNIGTSFSSINPNSSTIQPNQSFQGFNLPNTSFQTQNTIPTLYETQSNQCLTPTIKYKEMPQNIQERLKTLFIKIKTPTLNVQKFVLPEFETKENLVDKTSGYLKKEFHKLVEAEGMEVSEFTQNLNNEINIYNKEVNGEEYINNLFTTVNELLERVDEE